MPGVELLMILVEEVSTVAFFVYIAPTLLVPTLSLITQLVMVKVPSLRIPPAKLQGIEPNVSAELVRYAAKQVEPLIKKLGGTVHTPIARDANQAI